LQLTDLNISLNRNGGNHTSRYNWQQNASNRGADWYYQSVPEGDGTAGGAVDAFISASRSAGAQPMITIPTLGWVAKLGLARTKLSSYSILKYGPQQDRDWQWFPDAGNGVALTGQPITGNNPYDANTPADPTFQQAWVRHLVSKWGTAAQGGTRYYILDNEPSLWHLNHRDVRATGATMREVRDRMFAYGAAVKAVDPDAQLVGPEEWGWSGYFYSGYDQQYARNNGYPPISTFPDRAANGYWDYMPWLLDQLRQESARTGRRTLDVFTLHYYPQGGEFSNDTSSAMQLKRNRSTRSLWDPTYTDESWIGEPVRLIPRLKEWIAAGYPGTKIGITEWNFGADGHISGGLAIAEALGVFGREGVYLANYWAYPNKNSPGYLAFKLFRNADDRGRGLGDVSCRATSAAPDRLSCFAAIDTRTGDLSLMLVNKMRRASVTAPLRIAGQTRGAILRRWLLSAAAPTRLVASKPEPLPGDRPLTLRLPAQSVTLLRISSSPGKAFAAR